MKKGLIVITLFFISNIAFADIYSAAKNGNVEILKNEIKREGDINKKSPKNGETALHIAVASYKFSAVKFLIENGADINIKDFSGNDALMIAASKFPAVIDDLLKWGANPYTTNNNGKTALEILKTVKSIQIPSKAYREKKIRQFELAIKKYAKKYKEQNNNLQTASSNKITSKSCSKQEVLTMLNAGYNKSEIDGICTDKSYNKLQNNIKTNSNNHVKVKEKIAKVLRESTGFTREFLNTIKMTYSNNILVFYDNCPKLMKRNDKQLSGEYAKKEKEQKKQEQKNGYSWNNFLNTMGGDNAFSQSFKFKDKCYSMLNRAAKLGKTIEGVKEVEILK